MAEDQGPQRANPEARAEHRQAGQRLGGLVAGWEEQSPEEDRQSAVQVEVVPLEERPQGGGEDHPSQGGLRDRRGVPAGIAQRLAAAVHRTSLYSKPPPRPPE